MEKINLEKQLKEKLDEFQKKELPLSFDSFNNLCTLNLFLLNDFIFNNTRVVGNRDYLFLRPKCPYNCESDLQVLKGTSYKILMNNYLSNYGFTFKHVKTNMLSPNLLEAFANYLESEKPLFVRSLE